MAELNVKFVNQDLLPQLESPIEEAMALFKFV